LELNRNIIPQYIVFEKRYLQYIGLKIIISIIAFVLAVLAALAAGAACAIHTAAQYMDTEQH
jgi:hypothetical protein